MANEEHTSRESRETLYVCTRCGDIKKSARIAKECCGWGYRIMNSTALQRQTRKEHPNTLSPL